MQIGRLLISESAGAVIDALRLECIQRGLPYFFEFRESGSNIMTRCPFHKGGMERKPSFGISTSNMVCHCFSCGWAGGIDEVISQVLEHADDGGEYGRKWLAQRFLSISIDKRASLNIAARAARTQHVAQPFIVPFDEHELEKYRYYHDYMFKRGLTEQIIQEFDVGYDYETNCVTFPVYHLDGSPAFIARRSVESKYFNYPEEVDKPLYAAQKLFENIEKIKVHKKGVLIVESIFNCLTAWKQGWPAISLLGLGTATQYELLSRLPIRSYVLGLDPDEAGRIASEKLRKGVQDKIIRQLEIPVGYDINDLDIKLGIDINTLPIAL